MTATAVRGSEGAVLKPHAPQQGRTQVRPHLPFDQGLVLFSGGQYDIVPHRIGDGVPRHIEEKQVATISFPHDVRRLMDTQLIRWMVRLGTKHVIRAEEVTLPQSTHYFCIEVGSGERATPLIVPRGQLPSQMVPHLVFPVDFAEYERQEGRLPFHDLDGKNEWLRPVLGWLFYRGLILINRVLLVEA